MYVAIFCELTYWKDSRIDSGDTFLTLTLYGIIGGSCERRVWVVDGDDRILELCDVGLYVILVGFDFIRPVLLCAIGGITTGDNVVSQYPDLHSRVVAIVVNDSTETRLVTHKNKTVGLEPFISCNIRLFTVVL